MDVIREAMHNELGYAVTDKYKQYTKNYLKHTKREKSFRCWNLQSLPFREARRGFFKNVDGIKFLNPRAAVAEQDRMPVCWEKLLAAYANHPNVAGVTVLSLGCQNLQTNDF